MDKKHYITISGYNRLKDELHNLVVKERPFLVETINWAAGNGDRSENGDYIYGKRRLRELDRRIRFLTKTLEDAEIVDYTKHVGSNAIFFGATVSLLRNNQSVLTVKIVGQAEINPELNHISWTSPLARALIAKEEGDSFAFTSPIGTEEIEIIQVQYISAD